ncbi:MAG: DUF58 domain-containing protein [Chloroflexota bacterium]
MLVLLVIAAFFRVDFFFTAVYFLGIVFLLTRLWMSGLANKIYAERRYVPRAFTGDTVAVDLVVSNTSRLPVPWLEINESAAVELVASPLDRHVVILKPHERVSLRYTLHCQRRGLFRIGPLSARYGDLFDLSHQDLKWTGTDSIIVYPKVVPLEKLGLPTRSLLALLPTTSPLLEDSSRVMGVRPYRRGDSRRSIHWRATARMQDLVVKQFQPATSRETHIFLDLDEEGYPARYRYEASERAIVVTASLATHMVIRERLPVGLVTEAIDGVAGTIHRFCLPARTGRAALMNVLAVLARVEPQRSTGLVDLLREQSASLSFGATIVAIVGRRSAALFDMLKHLQGRGFAVALVVCQEHGAAHDQDGLDAPPGLRVHHVRSETDVRLWA